MAKKTVVKRVTRIKRVAVPVNVERKTTKRVRMPSLGRDVIDDVKVEKKSVLVGVPRAVVAPGRALKKKPAA